MISHCHTGNLALISKKGYVVKAQQILETHWYKKNNIYLSLLLVPFSALFFAISRIRYYLYHFGILKSYRLPVPVAIIGNITVGGVGKTPLTKHLALELIASGIQVGIILRGHKSTTKTAKIVFAIDPSSSVGDEALIYAKNNIPVAIGRNRYLAGLKLLEYYPNIQLILADDGLQHYRLQRDYEVAVIDATRVLGNQYVLPMGPLREAPSRLESVNALVINGMPVTSLEEQLNKLPLPKLVVRQSLVLDKIHNPITHEVATIEFLNTKHVLAMAAIGNPERFFSFLQSLGISLEDTLSFPDHYHYQPNDIPTTYDVILTTEKDYTKLATLKNTKIWLVNVTTKLDTPQLLTQIRHLVSTV